MAREDVVHTKNQSRIHRPHGGSARQQKPVAMVSDWVEPMHVHVEYGEVEAKFWMKPVRLAATYRMKAKDLKTARTLIEQRSPQIEEAWHGYFGNKIRK